MANPNSTTGDSSSASGDLTSVPSVSAGKSATTTRSNIGSWDPDDLRRRTPWFGVVGFAIPEGIELHPAAEDAALAVVDEGGLAMLVDRFDGNFGLTWGFDAPDRATAMAKLRCRAEAAAEILGASAVIESNLLFNRRLINEDDAEILDLHSRI